MLLNVHHDQLTLVLSRDFDVPTEFLWRKITDRAALAQWAPFEVGRDLASIGTTTLTMSDGQQSQEMETTITEVEPQHMVSYTWGTDLLRWNLEPIPRGTRLTLNQTSSSLDWLPKLAAGWHICLDVAARQLAGEDAPRIVGMEAMNHGWADLHVAYASVLGIDPTPLPES